MRVSTKCDRAELRMTRLVELNWQKFRKLTDARSRFTKTPCVYVQTDARGCPIRIGKASEACYRGGTGYAMDAATHHSDQPLSSLRLFSRAHVSNVNFKSQFPTSRCAILPAALRLIGSACCVTGDLGGEKCVCWKRIIASLLIFVIFAATCFGYPSHSGYNTVGINRSQTWDALHFADHPRRYRRQNLSRAHKGRHFAAQKDFAELAGSHPGIVQYRPRLFKRSFTGRVRCGAS